MEEIDAIFITDNTGFSLTFIEYHDLLQFRGFLSVSAIFFAVHQKFALPNGRNLI